MPKPIHITTAKNNSILNADGKIKTFQQFINEAHTKYEPEILAKEAYQSRAPHIDKLNEDTLSTASHVVITGHGGLDSLGANSPEQLAQKLMNAGLEDRQGHPPIIVLNACMVGAGKPSYAERLQQALTKEGEPLAQICTHKPKNEKKYTIIQSKGNIESVIVSKCEEQYHNAVADYYQAKINDHNQYQSLQQQLVEASTKGDFNSVRELMEAQKQYIPLTSTDLDYLQHKVLENREQANECNSNFNLLRNLYEQDEEQLTDRNYQVTELTGPQLVAYSKLETLEAQEAFKKPYQSPDNSYGPEMEEGIGLYNFATHQILQATPSQDLIGNSEMYKIKTSTQALPANFLKGDIPDVEPLPTDMSANTTSTSSAIVTDSRSNDIAAIMGKNASPDTQSSAQTSAQSALTAATTTTTADTTRADKKASDDAPSDNDEFDANTGHNPR